MDGWMDKKYMKKMVGWIKNRWMVGWIKKEKKKMDGWMDKNMKKIDGWLDG